MGRPSKSQERKKEIIQHFIKVLQKEGIEGASIAKIAESMDTQPSLIMHYYKNKDDMIVDMAEELFEKNLKMEIEHIKDTEDLHKRFNILLGIILINRSQSSDFKKLFPCLVYLVSRNRRVRNRLKKNLNQATEFFIQQFSLFMDEGIIKREDPARLVALLNSLGMGFALELPMDNIPENMEPYIMEKVKSMIC